MDRRNFLISVGSLSSFVLAGCSESEAPSEGDDDGTANGESEDAGEENGANDTADGDLEDADNETSDDGESADDDNPQLGEVLNWESSYEVEYDLEEGSGQGVYHESDFHWTWTEDGDTTETYRVDGEPYVVLNGQCYQETAETPDDDLVAPDEIEGEYENHEATGRTTIDGEDVYEFDVNGWSYFISVDTGYPVQIIDEDGGTIMFHSWGETEPISRPDMDCGSTMDDT